ncbi:MAG: hypothetical protein CO162_02405 [bacterium (Candidatus Ratteibacteria) CG_4_9_14_3_um_filter_41_21]|uniref:Glycosyltransferase n=3 Tax=Candidatus Ratteibacteria TaxID=2979319 RepID=A0A2M7E878_9BACT|nr:MAG: hypothetical protein COS11_04840 [bacterium (Candidatus Ratteibacteria) CG01_land_8_20_14_3_00_40_19]PIW34051.1 MAG: hypothetical protein COW28_01345 [bacterium (Candidatus Ratteibacteria) CG15_BIG_FIL_POST_REV_8_21_14_020_41_12]PJA62186.1 MAG: hypothetical protein CO162_02405 [bacterium (Candidatus Ratteibacteria) CG_4_9_14_3_um_filter_41_21]HCG76369.1 hypothetical protein [bacterium]
MKKIKVIHLIEDLKIGGAERVVANIAEGLDKERYQISIWCLAGGGEIADELKAKGIDLKILGIGNYHNPLNILKLILLLKKERFNIVHMHGYFATTIGRIAARISGIPILVTHLHTTHYNLKLRNIIVDKILNLFTQKIICVSEAVKKSFIDTEDGAKGKFIVIYNGIDKKKYTLHQLDDRREIITTVSSLYPHKGHTHLLKAMKEVLTSFPRVRFWIVGEGPLKEKLKKEAINLEISSQVSFLGKRKDIPEILSQSVLFVLPSLREGLPLTILEAIAVGLPVIATEVGGIPEAVIDKETGFLVPPENAEALAEAIINLLKNPKMMEEMGQKGRKIFEEKFTTQIMIGKLENLYQKLIGNYDEDKF